MGVLHFIGLSCLTYYCTNCWKEIEKDRKVCPHCKSEQEQLGRETFVQKLIRALRHPEPETPIRAAYVLGRLHALDAVPELINVIHESPDPYIAAACVEALGGIGGGAALDELKHILKLEHSVIVRRAVEDALMHHKASLSKKEI